MNEIKSQHKRHLRRLRGVKKLKKNIKKNKLNITKINERRNKNIDFKRRLTTFDSTMGSLSKDDVIPLLLDIKDKIYDLNNTYINNFDINAEKKTENYINKVNNTYMVRLDRTIATSISQFSPILSKDCFQKLLDNMYKEYYKLQKYLANITNHLQEEIDELIIKLKHTSYFMREVNDISYNKIIGYFNILTEVINSRYEIISDNNNKNNGNDNDNDNDNDNERRLNDIDEKQFESNYRDIKKKK